MSDPPDDDVDDDDEGGDDDDDPADADVVVAVDEAVPTGDLAEQKAVNDNDKDLFFKVIDKSR